jgi:hypothetical protein
MLMKLPQGHLVHPLDRGPDHGLHFRLPSQPRLRVAHDLDQHGLVVDLVRQPLFSGHHCLQHELHAEVRPRKVQRSGGNLTKPL